MLRQRAMPGAVRILLIAILPTGASPIFGESSIPKIGEPAPALDLEGILQAPSGASADWTSLKGKAVVVEFWGTYCATCIHLLPRLNRLEKTLEKQPVAFISITDEEESTVKSFLATTPKSGWIGLDLDRSVFRAYGVEARPDAVLVGADGTLLGWIHPLVLVNHPEILEQVLDGKRVEELRSSPHHNVPEAQIGLDIHGPDPLCLILIQPASGFHKSIPFSGTSRALRLDGLSILDLLSHAFDIPPAFIVSSVNLPKDKEYDLVFRWPDGPYEPGRKVLQDAITGAFGLRTRNARRDLRVLELRLADDQAPAWEQAGPGLKVDLERGITAPNEHILDGMRHGQEFFWTLGDTEELSKHLSNFLGLPVVDDTRIEGYYLFYFPCDLGHPNVDQVTKALEERYRLGLKAASREVQVLLVDQAHPPTSNRLRD